MSDPTPGTVLQGSDGSVYFIPADRLAEFRVAEEDSVGVREALELVAGDEVAGFSNPPQLKDGVISIKAFTGPIGISRVNPIIDGGDGIWTGQTNA